MASEEQLRAKAKALQLRAKAQLSAPTVSVASPADSPGVGEMLLDAVVDAAGNTAKMVDDWGRSLASGATFGYADEIAAGADALVARGINTVLPEGTAQTTTEFLGISPEYSENLARETERDEAIPTAQRITGEVAGGLATIPLAGAGLVAGGARVAPGLTRAAVNAPIWAKVPVAGGAVGAAYGSGSSAPGERLEGAATGGALGALMAPAAYYGMAAAGEGISRVGQAIQNRVRPGSAAQRQVIQAFADDAVRPGQARVNLTRMGPQATLADAGGENVVTLARRAASEPGPARNQAMQVYRDRAVGEGGRIMGQVRQGLGERQYYQTQDELLATLRNNAQGLYDEAYRAGRQLDSPKLNKLLNRPVIQDAMKEAADLARIEGRRVSPLDPSLTAQANEAIARGLMSRSDAPKGGIGRGVTTEAIDDLKRGLDVLIDRERNQLTGRLNKRGAALNSVKNELLREVDRLNPAYARAREVYSGDAETLQAIEQGRKALNRDPEIIARTLDGMSDASREAYRTGAARAILDVVRKTPDTTSAANRLGAKGLTRDQLRAIFPDEASYNRLINTLETEMRFQGVRNTITGGSPTARIQADQRAWGGGPVQDALNNPGGLTQGLLRSFIERFSRPNPLVSDELARILMTQGSEANRKALNQLLTLSKSRQTQSFAIKNIERAIANATAQQTGTVLGRY